MDYESLSENDKAVIDNLRKEIDVNIAKLRDSPVLFGSVYDIVKDLIAHPSLAITPHKQVMFLNALSAKVRRQ